MTFTQIEFVLAFVVVLALVAVLRGREARKNVLLVASAYFYAYWDWRFLGLLAVVVVASHVAARQIERAGSRRAKRAWLAASVVTSLGVLATFKYLGFFLDAVSPALEAAGLRAGVVSIILPVGISFYTFQALSSTIDVYRGNVAARPSLRDHALYVAFFPQLVAGPIVRAADFLPQLDQDRGPSRDRLLLGLREFSVGLFKKVFIADRIAPLVDDVFSRPLAYDSATLWLAVLAYAAQIYCDFSGYSDMAIGTARALGYDLRENFDRPYLAASPAEFWHRWHISLSSWLRDYLYIPLGGSRQGPWRTHVNLMLTMLLGGLWHGASWTFVAWGAWHGLALSAHRFLGERGWLALLPGWLRLHGGRAVTLLVVLLGWVLFRAPDFPSALAMARGMFVPTQGFTWLFPFAFLAIALVALGHALALTRWKRWLDLSLENRLTPFLTCLLLWLAIAFRSEGFQPFIYFQF